MRETSRLVAALAGARVAGALPPTVDALASDSRAVRPGTLFVALRGERTDGHAFVPDAVARGAAAVVVEHGTDVPAGVPAIVVADTRVAASKLADAFYDFPSRDLIVVGITGTNGKTTTSHLV
jgi:UDP-N-acetylmuramoyl-L-alanyl-D-glutamate--2,6-diaminopimelate ligase